MENRLVEFIKENPIVLLVAFFIVYLIYNKKKEIIEGMTVVPKFALSLDNSIFTDAEKKCNLAYLSNQIPDGNKLNNKLRCLVIDQNKIATDSGYYSLSADSYDNCKTTEYSHLERIWCGGTAPGNWALDFSLPGKNVSGTPPTCSSEDTYITCKNNVHAAQLILYNTLKPFYVAAKNLSTTLTNDSTAWVDGSSTVTDLRNAIKVAIVATNKSPYTSDALKKLIKAANEELANIKKINKRNRCLIPKCNFCGKVENNKRSCEDTTEWYIESVTPNKPGVYRGKRVKCKDPFYNGCIKVQNPARCIGDNKTWCNPLDNAEDTSDTPNAHLYV